MHELSIALSIVDIAEDQVKRSGANKVDAIELEIGKLSGVELDSLDFVWDQAVRSTVLEGADRNIDHISGRARCMECDKEFEIEEIFDPCPDCDQYFNDVIQGRELRVRSLTIT